MRIRLIQIVLLLLAVGLVLWLAGLSPSGRDLSTLPSSGTVKSSDPFVVDVPTGDGQSKVERRFAEAGISQEKLNDRPEVPPTLYFDSMKKAFSHPIEFYGKVVDQDGNPVPGVDVYFGWAKPPPHECGNKATTQSGPEGLFELRGAVGRTLSVRIHEDGWWTFSITQQVVQARWK